jgi:hypothetical protein
MQTAATRLRGEQKSSRAANPGAGKQWMSRLRFHPVPLAGAIAAAALAIVYFGPKQIAPRGKTALDLTATRGAGDAVEAPAYHSLDLSLDLTGVSASGPYRIDLADERGSILRTATQAASGNRLTVSYADGVKPGLYWVRVSSPEGRLLREYGFQAREQPSR